MIKDMGTKKGGTTIHGNSDDLVSCYGDISDEYGCFGTDDRNQGIILSCSDGTVLEAKYGKLGLGIWEIKCHREGSLFEKIETCNDDEAKIYSDQAHFKAGLKWIIAADEWSTMT
jgi:hypothetical protein